jgi:hypothetical protein
VIILHPAVGQTDLDHRLELLGDSGGGLVGEDPRRLVLQQNGVVDPTRIRHDGVIDPDVEPQDEPCPAQVPCNLHADAGIPILDGDGLGVDLGFEREPIVELDREALGDDATDRLRGVVDASEEVDVAGRPRDCGIPDPQHHSAFDHETIRPLRLRQSEEEPLHRVVEDRLLEVQAQLRGPSLQSTAYLNRGLGAHISAWT